MPRPSIAGRGNPNYRHGGAGASTRSSVYNIWAAMVQRCTNPRVPGFRNYGGRGIVVCDRWRSSFAAFTADMGPRPDGHTLDRIDNEGPYAPDNCRWVLPREQSRNSRRTRVLVVDGRPMAMRDVASQVGVAYTTLKWRLDRGWALARALTPGDRRRHEDAEAQQLDEWDEVLP